MKAFTFRLASVQRLREYAERQQKDVLSREQQILRLLEEEAKNLETADGKWSAWYLHVCETGVIPVEMMRIQSYLSELRAQKTENSRRIRTQEQAVERARRELLEKMRERKSMDALYEKQLLAYRNEQKIQMEKEIGELVSARLGG